MNLLGWTKVLGMVIIIQKYFILMEELMLMSLQILLHENIINSLEKDEKRH